MGTWETTAGTVGTGWTEETGVEMNSGLKAGSWGGIACAMGGCTGLETGAATGTGTGTGTEGWMGREETTGGGGWAGSGWWTGAFLMPFLVVRHFL